MTQPPALPDDCCLTVYDAIGSTNEEAKRLASEGAGDKTFVWAREQTAGRGRRGNNWISPPGNMYLSVVLRPECDMATAAQLGFVAALALADAIVARTGAEPRLKWPNDLLIGGRKVSGILVESAGGKNSGVDWVVIGTGVNVASCPENIPSVTSLSALGSTVTVEELIETYANSLLARLAQWRQRGFGVVREAWLERAAGIGSVIRVRLPDRVEEGVFESLDETGALVLVQGARRQRITSGDVFPAVAA